MKYQIVSFLNLLIILVISKELTAFKLPPDLNPRVYSEEDMINGPETIEFKGELFPNNKVDYSIGQVGGIATDANENLVVFHRASRRWTISSFLPGNQFNTFLYGPIKEDVLYLINPVSLEKLDQWGSNMFYMPHGLTIDFQGNVWLTDVGTHQVYKYNLDKDAKEPLMVLGEKFKNGNDESHFCKPTSTVVSESSGDIFVADGYCNSRIVRFDKNGKYLAKYQDEKKPIQVAHSIALIQDLNLICTVSRQEGRIVCFDIDSGNKMHEITDKKMNTVYAIKYDPIHKVIQAATGENSGSEALGLTFDASKENFGKLVQRYNADENDLADAHDIALSASGTTVYFGQLNGVIDQFGFA